MTKFVFTCPVCKIGVNGRNARRHVRRVHGRYDIPRGFERFARRRLKAYLRDPRYWERTQVWTWLKEARSLTVKYAAVTEGAWIVRVMHDGTGAIAP